MKITEYDYPSDYNRLNERQKGILQVWIKNYLKKIQSVNESHSSYGLKHLFEASPQGFYITNGMFKGAMLASGFFTDDENTLNWSFNVSQKSVRELYRLVNHEWKNR